MRMPRFVRQLPVQVLLILWTALVIVPFILITLLAFRDQRDIFAFPLGVGGDFIIDNFALAWEGPAGGQGLGVYLLNSAVIVVAAIVVNLVLGVPSAYFSTFLAPRAKNAFMRVFLVGTVVPLVLLVIPYFQMFDSFGLTNNPLALGVAYGVISLPTTVLVLHAFFLDFPSELVEAAEMDGLGLAGSFVRIVLPLAKGGIVAVSLLALIFVWGEAQLGIVLLQYPAYQSVPVGILGFRGQFTVQLGPIFAGLAIASIPIIIVYLIFNRFVSKGIALGGSFR